MENQILNFIISPIILIAIGIGLIAMEAIVFSFYFFWFGLAFLIVGILSFFGVFSSGLLQLSSVAIVALLLLYLLKNKTVIEFLKSKEKKNNDNFLNEEGIGIIKNNKVYYKATYWSIDPKSENDFIENEKVIVLSALKGIVKVKKFEAKR